MDPKYGISNKQWNDVTAEFFEAVKGLLGFYFFSLTGY